MTQFDDKPIYAYRDGKIVSIAEVSSGLACNCFCPKCKGKLIAKKGDVKAHHFAHYRNSNCNYSFLESVTEKLKVLLEETKSIYIPNISSKTSGVLSYGKTIPIDSIKVKNIFSGKLDSIEIFTSNVPLIVHLFVNTKIVKGFTRKLEEIGISGIGIDVSKISGFETTDAFYKLITEPSDSKFWIYNKKAAEHDEKCKTASKVHSQQLDFEQMPSKDTFICKYQPAKTSTKNEPNIVVKEQKKEIQTQKIREFNPLDADIQTRAREIMLERARAGASEEDRKPINIIRELRAEYIAGKTEWAKKVRNILT